MAIAFDALSTGEALGATSVTFSHTVSGSNRILFVLAETQDTAGATSVTYGGASLTKIQSNVTAKGGSNRGNLWFLINPASGANNVVISRAGSSGWITGIALSYTGVVQTNPIDVSGMDSGAATPATQIITTTVDKDWAIFVVGSTGSQTASTNSFKRGQMDHVAIYDNSGVGDITPAGNFNMKATVADSWQSIMAAFSPVPPVVTAHRFFQMF